MYYDGTGVVWVGDYHAAYKASPEIQRLVGWAAVQPTPALQQAGSKQSTHPHSLRPAKGVHAFVRQTENGSSVVVLDVSFPQTLADELDGSDSTIQPNLQQNVSGFLTSFVIKPQPKFHPATAALADWQAPLDVVCHSQCRLAASGPGRISVTAPAEFAEVHPEYAVAGTCSKSHFSCTGAAPCELHVSINHCTLLLALQAVLVWLTAQPQVHWVSARAKTRAANFFATGIGQCGNAATLDDAKLGLDQDAGTHPFWKAGRAQRCFPLSHVHVPAVHHLATVLTAIGRQSCYVFGSHTAWCSVHNTLRSYTVVRISSAGLSLAASLCS